MRALLGLALAALAPPVAARLLAEEAEDETEEEVRHYAIAIGVGLLGVTFVVGHIMEVLSAVHKAFTLTIPIPTLTPPPLSLP